MPNRRSTDLQPHEKGYAPEFDVHGYAVNAITDPPGAGARNAVVTVETVDPATGQKVVQNAVVTFAAYRKDTNEVITVDDRTFDGTAMSLTLEVYDLKTGEKIVLKDGRPFDPALYSLDPVEVQNA
jgi:hypothetical protein